MQWRPIAQLRRERGRQWLFAWPMKISQLPNEWGYATGYFGPNDKHPIDSRDLEMPFATHFAELEPPISEES